MKGSFHIICRKVIIVKQKFILKTTVFSLVLLVLAVGNVSAASPISYDIQYTNDTIPVQTVSSSSSDNREAIFNYDGTFSHLIYSTSTVFLKKNENVYIEGEQQSTNSNYPSLNVQYAFVDKGTKASDPSDDVLITTTTYQSVGDYSEEGEFSVSFKANSKATSNGKSVHLRAWNYNNYDGSSHSKTVHIKGTVYKDLN